MNQLYYNMGVRVIIGNVEFKQVNSVSIFKTLKSLSDTANLVLPREFTEATVNKKEASIAGKNITDYINTGDKVEIYLFYDDDEFKEFSGHVEKVGADVPLKISCEDEMYVLKESSFTETFAQTSLKDLISFIAPNYQVELIGSVNLGKFTLNNESAYDALVKLRELCGLHSWFQDKVLHVGFMSDLKPQIVHEFNLDRNIRKRKTSLEFTKTKDKKILFKGISLNKDGSKITEEYGDKKGAVRTLHFYEKTKEELQELIKKNYESLNFDGYQGSIASFGLPKTQPGESAKITDLNYENSERDGKYLIEGVTIKFNKSEGFLRQNKLGLKL